jgi:hypothetical protein
MAFVSRTVRPASRGTHSSRDAEGRRRPGKRARSGTVQVNAGDWMTANGGGVTVYSNGDSNTVSNDYSAPAVGMKWQCLELTQRSYQAKGWHSGYWNLQTQTTLRTTLSITRAPTVCSRIAMTVATRQCQAT